MVIELFFIPTIKTLKNIFIDFAFKPSNLCKHLRKQINYYVN